MTISLDSTNKWIKILPFHYTILTAIQSGTIVTVNEAIDEDTPSSGLLMLGTYSATHNGNEDLSGGYDWATNPENFKFHGYLGGPDTVYLNANCPTFAAVLAHLNARLALAAHDHSQQYEFVEDLTNPNHVLLRGKSGYECTIYSFILDVGSPNALNTLGFAYPEVELGFCDMYYYSSWSGSVFTLKAGTSLSKTYTVGYSCDASYESINVQDIYNLTMEWVDEQEAMDDDVPMQAIGKKPIATGVYTDIIFELMNGWKIKFFNGIYSIIILGTLITDDGSARTVPVDWGGIEFVFQTGTSSTIVTQGSGVTEQDKQDIANLIEAQTGIPIKAKVNPLPSDPASETTATIIRKIQTNKWKIVGNQLIIFDDDGITPYKTFNLSGESTKPYSERIPT